MKTCSKCGGSGPFHRDRSAPDGLYSICKECKTAYNHTPERAEARRLRNIEKRKEIREYKLQRKFGMSLQDFESMLRAQDYHCMLCPTILESTCKANTPHVDHCHKSNVVRGILCTSCNVMLGMAKDDPARLIRGASYLIEHLNEVNKNGALEAARDLERLVNETSREELRAEKTDYYS